MPLFYLIKSSDNPAVIIEAENQNEALIAYAKSWHFIDVEDEVHIIPCFGLEGRWTDE